MLAMAKAAKKASFILGQLSSKEKDSAIRKMAESIEQTMRYIFSANAKDIKAVNAQLIKLQKTEEKALKLDKLKLDLDKKEEKLKKKTAKLTDEEIKDKIKLQKINKDRKDNLKETIILSNKLAGTEERLLATNSKLQRQRK